MSRSAKTGDDLSHIAPALRALAVPLSAITPDPQNARLHGDRSLDAIQASLRQFGQQKPIVVSADGIAVAGNGVLLASAALKWSHVAAVRSNLKAEALRAFAIADNRTGELSEWDEDRLAEQLRELAAAEIDLAGLGFTSDELADVLHEAVEPPTADAAPASGPAVSQVGQLYRLGKHLLLCGDATQPASYAALLGSRDKAALCVTSPPYGVGKSYESQGLEPWFQTIRPVIRHLCLRAEVVVWNLGDLYTTGGQHIEPTFAYSLDLFRQHGHRPLWIRIWAKQGMNFGVSPYHLSSTKPAQQYEYLGAFGTDEDGVVISREDFSCTDFEWIVATAGAKYRYVRRLSPRQRRQWGYAGIWQINTVTANDDHPAKFPIELPLRAILMHTDPEDLVLEPFAGSGTTLMAAEQTGRSCRAIELDPRYCDLVRRQWARHAHGEGCDWATLTPWTRR